MKKIEDKDLEQEIAKLISSYLASHNKEQCVADRVSIAMRIAAIVIKEVQSSK